MSSARRLSSKWSELWVSSLTRYPLASFRELATLSLPLIFSNLSSSLLGFCDRLFLSHFSLLAWNASSSAGYLAFLYQTFCIVIAMISQSFIGQYLGANQPSKVGPIVWQMIWFSFLSMLITYPTSFCAELYFKGTEIEREALAYFRPMALCNFLYPLSAALTAFFLGTGKTLLIFLANLSIQFLNAVLDYFLIFGFGSLIPPLGTFGAALATLASEATLCLILFMLFLKPHYHLLYQTSHRKFDFSLLKEMLKIGIPRAIGRAIMVSSWAFAAHLLIKNGGDYLLVLTLGTSLFALFTFINEGFLQAIVTIASHILGANKEYAIPRLIYSAVQLLGVAMFVLSIPLVFMREQLISFFINTPLSETTFNLLKHTCTIVWFGCLANGIGLIAVSFIIASRDTLFYACLTSVNWIILCLPVYVTIDLLKCSPPIFFFIESLATLFFGGIYFYRFRKGKWKERFYNLHHVV